MSSKKQSNNRLPFHPGIIWALVIVTVAYRVFISAKYPMLSNSSPTMALCFGGGLLLGARFWWIPAALVLGSDCLLGLVKSGSGFSSFTILAIVLFCGAAWLGSRASKWSGKTWPALWCGVLLSSVVFYVASNTFSWMLDPSYAKTLAGWWQSQTIGNPAYSPQSWVFLRNALIGDSIWCGVAGLLFFSQRFIFPAAGSTVSRLAD